MKPKQRTLTLTWITAMTILVALATAVRIAAQDDAQKQSTPHHHYKLIDLGTFGGPASYFSNGFDGILNNQGTAVGWADTPTPDPFPAFCFNPDCSVSHAFVWQNGLPTDLGALPEGASSEAFWISANGLIAGNSQNGEGDPLFPGWGQFRAVLWKDGQIIDLGTLEGGYESFVGNVNSRGDVVGLAMNTVPDPFNINGPGFFPTQSRAFLWQNGVMQDLGTLGGTDANAILINEGGQIVGTSYTNSTPNPTTGIPTIDPFLWKNGTMMDLGTLGGTIGNPTAFNNRGQVVGISNLSGDLFSHPFLWTENGGMQDLGTLGGNTGLPNWINDAGDIVGKTDLPGPLSPEDHHAVLWSHGAIIDLGTFPEDTSSNAYNVNARGQVVGTSEDRAHMLIGVGEHAFLWENGGPMVDLNTLIPADSSLQLTYAVAINNRGEIAGFGVPPGVPPQDYEFQGHAYMLIPCDENHPNIEGCDYSAADATTVDDVRPTRAIQSAAGAATESQAYQSETMTRFHPMMANRRSSVAASTAPHNLTASALNTYQIRMNWQEASGQNQRGFNIYRCHGCSSPRTQGTRIASVGASVFTYTNGSSTSPVTESTTYTYQVTAFSGSGESAPSNASSATTKTEPAPINLTSFAFERGFDDVVRLSWTNNSTDDDSYFVESCTGLTCTNFSLIAQLSANATAYNQYFQFASDPTLRYRVRTHSPGGYSAYSNIRNQPLP